LVRATVAAAAATIATTTALAAANGDVRSLPMISDTFAKAPESYVSRLGVVAVACGLLVVSWVTHAYLRAFAASAPRWRSFARLGATLGAVAALALGVVGAVSDRENLPLHFAAATVFFFAMLGWQIATLAQLALHPAAATPASIRVKTAAAVVSAVSLAGFFALAPMIPLGAYGAVAAFEWVYAASVGVSVWSLARELDGDGSAVNVPGDYSPGEGRGEPPASRGMTLGSVWRGPTPGPDEMLDVLVPEADGYARLEGGGEAREG
jgi:hypothetical protein